MAYGQTGSGKTYSMFGPPGKTMGRAGISSNLSKPNSMWQSALTKIVLSLTGISSHAVNRGKLSETAGIIPRAIADVFMAVRRREAKGNKITVYCSFVQIYNEQVRELETGKVDQTSKFCTFIL